MLIAQITDFHLKRPGELFLGTVDVASRLAAVVAEIARLDPAPDIVVATGDLVDDGLPEQYELLRQILSPLSLPLLLIPGNHDRREALRTVFADHDYLPRSGSMNWCVDDFPARLVGLDSLVPGADHGELGEDSAAWLSARLGEQKLRPTIVFIHHPPFASGIGYMDRIALRDATRLAAAIRPHVQVERVISGHLHRTAQCRFAGTIASTAPSTAHQLALDLRERAPARYHLEPPGYQLHRLSPAGLVTHTVTVGDFGVPAPSRRSRSGRCDNLRNVSRKLAAVQDGDRQMVDLLTAVLTDGLVAAAAACAEALRADIHPSDVHPQHPRPPARACGAADHSQPPTHSGSGTSPAADCARYDSLRKAI